MRAGFLVLAFLFNVSWASAQSPPAETQVQQGRVVTDEAVVYRDPDFDSPPLGILKKGTTWTISKRIFGAFYQVRLPKNRLGYVTDVDIRSLADLKRPGKSKSTEGARLEPEDSPQQKRNFTDQSFRGVSLLSLRYREETMGLRPSENLLLLGYKAAGNDVVIEGLMTEMNIQFSLAPPKYYERATGRSTDGFLFLLDMMLLNSQPRGANTMTFWGVGPLFRYSKYNVTLPINGRDEFYSLDDMTLGLKFNLGLTQRFDPIAVRVDVQYFWEKLQYYGFSVSALYRF